MNLTEIVKRYANGAEVLADWLGSGGECVNVPQAQERTDICLKCPNNLPGSFVTGIVTDAIRSQLELQGEIGLKTDGIGGLKTCAVCNCELKLKVFVPLGFTGVDKKEANEEFPAWCWLPLEHNKPNEQNTHQGQE
jgi:hypothetical protein